METSTNEKSNSSRNFGNNCYMWLWRNFCNTVNKKQYSCRSMFYVSSFLHGKQKFVDSAGRVERFKQKFKWTQDSTKGGSDDTAENSKSGSQEAVAVEEKPETGSAD